MMALILLRCVFLLVAAGAGVSIINGRDIQEGPAWVPGLVFTIIMAVAVIVIATDMLVPRKRIEIISTVYFGILIGILLTFAVLVAMTPLFEENELLNIYRTEIQLMLGMILCYACISLLMQTKDDFRFIIPYVEFSKELKGVKPFILDTSVVIDGRIADVVETYLTENQLIMPRFVLAELQSIADSSDRLRRSRGRRGLDILNRMRNEPSIDLQIHDREFPGMADQPVDMKLIILAKHLQGKVVTGDYNLNKIAKLHNVDVINLNDLANALKPVFLPGENVEVRIVKAGEEPGQGVGYLDDGTMIVVEGAREHINDNVRIAVTSVLQTSAGRMVFGKIESPVSVS